LTSESLISAFKSSLIFFLIPVIEAAADLFLILKLVLGLIISDLGIS
jgi:hypothetical protein